MGLTRSDISFDLPVELIAQHPAPERSGSRLLLVEREARRLSDCMFRSLPDLLSPGDLLVFNDTRVTRARLRGRRRDTGGLAEILLLERISGDTWSVMLKPARRCRPGAVLDLQGGLEGTVVEVTGPGRAKVSFRAAGDLENALDAAGEVPLPPYIRREAAPEDSERYQTVYADRPGAVAAPTAGLHFDSGILSRLRERGIETTMLTLHVGPGTFEPLRHDELDRNSLEPERYEIGEACAKAVSTALSEDRRVIAVGTTSARVLETAGRGIAPSEGRTSLFIRPPCSFGVVAGLVTNFHLPGSSLLCLVSALMGLDFMHEAYSHAIGAGYRFYSYGDAMLIL
ncbi:MAG: tRNA preQ1(34) S-adenosylmethionine ribosyltransferase-isomerase QueA [Candidatus Fermentibacter sp.]|nr:tRNA preQ1(34) S-adenosylmethionine ribosyltransferase-isomerase QueA [Candidatus Fermentibacter sp.]